MIVPSPFCTTVPCAGCIVIVTLVGSILPNGSFGSSSLAVTSVVTGVSSNVLSASSLATGGSFAGATVIVTVAVSQLGIGKSSSQIV